MSALWLGSSLLAACVVTFVLVLPRGGRTSPLLPNATVETVFMTIWIMGFLAGLCLVLLGPPAGITFAGGR
jgi:hypothetical protein